MPFLQEMFDPECLKNRRTSGEPESFSDKPYPLENTPVLRLVGVLLWVSLRTCPNIAWAVARITRLASSDEARAHVCIRHVAQY